ncbi:P-loop containing nucleoside triphosphate hydrolase protein [Laetiporus sulphureus 93-53]|uniref:p-loop containing nucleoside triphosphate hydrolase protein n=1 Tax=Laetiporus sulphureus 93-53 TaxID=1314785 RepID=A0A165ETW4_9APHY|nr:P-loop containing nucleoside triphosphate hydrolase protein [Laetiporus sulphureus 93-53]KZT07752.1 P-loop containing nucleoside triphosphate hydrolase protein [Laetiporus sulphureus 93-53]
MRLQHLTPPPNQGLLDALEKCGIRTDVDLLFSDTPMNTFKKLPTKTISLHDFNQLISKVTEQAAVPGIRGDELLEALRRRQEEDFHGEITTGVTALDKLLGGLNPPRVIEVSGDRGSGKTAFALQVVLRHLSSVYDAAALWIDTTGDLAIDRISDLLESYRGDAKATVMDRLQIALAFDIEAAHEVLESLRLSLSLRIQSDPKPHPMTRIVVIDAITPLIGPLLSAVSSQGHAIMTTFMRQLRSLAESFSLLILVINTSTKCLPRNPDSAFMSTDRKPALGPSFTFLTDTTLWISQTDDVGEEADGSTIRHVAEVFRSRHTASRTWCSFNLRQGMLTE